LLFFSLAICWGLNAQPNNEVLKVSQGDNLNEVVENDIQYAFEEFTDGIVIYKNGATGTGKLNYNYLTSEMMFIQPNTNDILALVEISDIVKITIAQRQFIPAGGKKEFVELLTTKGSVYLALSRRAKALSVGKTGAYGTVSATSSISSLSHVGTGTQTVKLSVKDNIKVKTDDMYYLYSNGKAIIIKNVKSYTKVYPSTVASAIEKYVADNNISFRKRADLIKLTEYCNQLQ
jgi:hypothetical protein